MQLTDSIPENGNYEIGANLITYDHHLIKSSTVTYKASYFGIKSSPLYSFRNLYDETPFPLLYEYGRVKYLWSD